MSKRKRNGQYGDNFTPTHLLCNKITSRPSLQRSGSRNRKITSLHPNQRALKNVFESIVVKNGTDHVNICNPSDLEEIELRLHLNIPRHQASTAIGRLKKLKSMNPEHVPMDVHQFCDIFQIDQMRPTRRFKGWYKSTSNHRSDNVLRVKDFSKAKINVEPLISEMKASLDKGCETIERNHNLSEKWDKNIEARFEILAEQNCDIIVGVDIDKKKHHMLHCRFLPLQRSEEEAVENALEGFRSGTILIEKFNVPMTVCNDHDGLILL